MDVPHRCLARRPPGGLLPADATERLHEVWAMPREGAVAESEQLQQQFHLAIESLRGHSRTLVQSARIDPGSVQPTYSRLRRLLLIGLLHVPERTELPQF